MLFLSLLRHVMEGEVTSAGVRGSIEKVSLPWIMKSVSSPSFIL